MNAANKWRLNGNLALVTGGGSGIGKAIAERFKQAGAQVVIAGRTISTIEVVAAAIGAEPIQADVSREADVQRLFATIIERYGRLDIFINNAGVCPGR